MGEDDRKSSRKHSRKHRSRSRDRDDLLHHSSHSRSRDSDRNNKKSASRSVKKDNLEASEHERMERLSQQSALEQEAKAKAASTAGGTKVGAISMDNKNSLGSSQHSRRAKKDPLRSSEHARKERLAQQSLMEQEAKARAASSTGGTTVGAKSIDIKSSLGTSQHGHRSKKESLGASEHARKERLAQQSIMEQEAKARAGSSTGGTAVGAISVDNKNSLGTSQHGRREAKERSKGGHNLTVGAFSESKDRDVADGKRQARSGLGSPSSTAKTSKAGLSNTGNLQPGVYESSSTRQTSVSEMKARRRERSTSPVPPSGRRARMPGIKSPAPSSATSAPPPSSSQNIITADVAHDNNVMPAVAKPIQDTTDEDDRNRLLNLEVQNGQIRMQMQRVYEKQQEEEEERIQQVSMARRHRNKIIAVVVAVVLIVGAVVGYILIRPTKGPDITIVAVTDSPTTSPPTEFPSSTPTAYFYPRPSASECEEIRAQNKLSDQDSLETEVYWMSFEVVLVSEELISSDWYEQLLTGLRDRFVPNLACCEESTIVKEARCLVANADVAPTTQDVWTVCGADCRLVYANLQLYFKGNESIKTHLELLDEVITGYETISTTIELNLDPAVFRSAAPKEVFLTRPLAQRV